MILTKKIFLVSVVYIPFFTIIEFIGYIGWIKVAETLLNPWGDDDEDFQINYLIDRNFQVGKVNEWRRHVNDIVLKHFIFIFRQPITLSTKPWTVLLPNKQLTFLLTGNSSKEKRNNMQK